MLPEARSESAGYRRWAVLLLAVLGAVALCAVPVLGPMALYPAVPAIIAVAALLIRRLTSRVSAVRAAVVASLLSLTVDVVCFGPPIAVACWLTVEMTALLLMIVVIVRRSATRTAFVVGGLLAVTAVVLPLRSTLRLPDSMLEASVLGLTMALLAIGAVIGVGLYLRSADARRARAVSAARRAQRLSLARDLHDFVAHEITGIVLEAQAAQVGRYDEAASRELFARIEQAGMRALTSMDHTLRTLRDPEEEAPEADASPRLYSLTDLPEVVQRFSAGGAVSTELRLDAGLVDAIPREVDTAAYRVVVEALTNVRRHAPTAGRVLVSVTWTDDGWVRSTVSDDGGGHGASQGREGGTGLIGLAERVEALGGTLTAGQWERGWRVECLLPVADPATVVAPDEPRAAGQPAGRAAGRPAGAAAG
jgi:signal transduction histidine kinase